MTRYSLHQGVRGNPSSFTPLLLVTRGRESAHVLAALKAGITIFEGTLGGIDVPRIPELGTLVEQTVGRRLRSEAILNGRIPKTPARNTAGPSWPN